MQWELPGRPWTRLFGLIEIGFQLPTAAYGVYLLLSSSTRSVGYGDEMLFFLYALETAFTTLVCVHDVAYWDDAVYSPQQKRVFWFQLYGPWLLVRKLLLLFRSLGVGPASGRSSCADKGFCSIHHGCGHVLPSAGPSGRWGREEDEVMLMPLFGRRYKYTRARSKIMATGKGRLLGATTSINKLFHNIVRGISTPYPENSSYYRLKSRQTEPNNMGRAPCPPFFSSGSGTIRTLKKGNP